MTFMVLRTECCVVVEKGPSQGGGGDLLGEWSERTYTLEMLVLPKYQSNYNDQYCEFPRLQSTAPFRSYKRSFGKVPTKKTKAADQDLSITIKLT